MAIQLSINVLSPLTQEDHELLSGVSVMLLAIANHELAKERFPDAFPDEEPTEAPVPSQPCGECEGFDEPGGTDDTGKVCISKKGHRGRHAFRPVAAVRVN